MWVLRGFAPLGDRMVTELPLVHADDEDVRRLRALPADDPLVFVYPVAGDLVRELADQFEVALPAEALVYFLYADAP